MEVRFSDANLQARGELVGDVQRPTFLLEGRNARLASGTPRVDDDKLRWLHGAASGNEQAYLGKPEACQRL